MSVRPATSGRSELSEKKRSQRAFDGSKQSRATQRRIGRKKKRRGRKRSFKRWLEKSLISRPYQHLTNHAAPKHRSSQSTTAPHIWKSSRSKFTIGRSSRP